MIEEFRYVCPDDGLIESRSRNDLGPRPESCPFCGKPVHFEYVSGSSHIDAEKREEPTAQSTPSQ